MKNKIFKNLLILILVLPVLAIGFLCAPKNAKADEPSGACVSEFIEMNVVGLSYGADNTYQIMRGEAFEVDAKNLSTTEKLRAAVYVFPRSISGALTPYKKTDDVIIEPQETYPLDINITTETPGDYRIRVSGYLLKENGQNDRMVCYDRDLTIRSEGIVFAAGNPTEATIGDLPKFTIKIFGHENQTFSVYVDEISGDRLKENVQTDNSEPFVHIYQWPTAGTSAGTHKIIVALPNGTSESYSVQVNAPGTGGGGTGGRSINTFNITDLNNYNIKKLLSSCGTAVSSGGTTTYTFDDLKSIVCMVDKVIDWALDIGAVVAFIMILYASIIYLTSYGEESKVELAKKTLIWSFVGVAVIGVAAGIMKIVENLFKP